MLVLFVGLAMLFAACQKDPSVVQAEEQLLMHIPDGFPSVHFPTDNMFSMERWTLGKRLFYDPILSNSYTVSCASCHLAKNAFSDTTAFSIGDGQLLGRQNAPTLTNVAFNPYYTRAGGVPTLEIQILVPIQEHDEFNSNIVDLAERLKQIPSYVEQSQRAYGRTPDPFVITRAIATFERSLVSGNSAYDQFISKGNTKALSASALRGKKLFFSTKTNCLQCHSGFNFTNYAFENNGLYNVYADSGRMRLTRLESDRARFKVPTLRNIEVTGPYMHDGSFKTLKEVVHHYNTGGKSHPNKSILVKPLHLSETEEDDLVAFLQSLTDKEFINKKIFKNE